ncbi:hypothetical protein [Streptomyces sp. AM 2-1-1]|uniref:hypothetical protein n=1 Tax=Streptomyces sp. AM 2-1-1 TaxID=3028709 RepID=UPI0023B97FC6|nr:hypothetical protein [Streptomyces sp. AM 2-1-1]WEH40817.1 hypothetical protein PZB77_15605 [Streptomyces sp. AM 2-1-1]
MEQFLHQDRVAAWLTQGHPAERGGARSWRFDDVTVVPLGGTYEAVRIPVLTVRAAAGSSVWSAVADRLSELLGGPAFYTTTYLYALVPVGTADSWSYGPAAPCLGLSTYLGVPRLPRAGEPQQGHAGWLQPPRRPGDLCVPAAVAALVELGTAAEQQLADELPTPLGRIQ